MPKQIGKLKNRTALDLSTNQLMGPIPSETGDITKNSKIDFHANRLNGAIPCELGKLTNLIELRLSNSSLTGIILGSNDSSMVPTNSDDQIGVCQLTQLAYVDLSYNFLVGDIPTCFKQIKKYTFVFVARMFQAAIAAAGGIKALVDLIFRWPAGSDGVLERAAGALANLAADDKCSLEVAKAGGVHALVTLARSRKLEGVLEQLNITSNLHAEVPAELIEAKKPLLQERHVYSLSRFLVYANEEKI